MGNEIVICAFGKDKEFAIRALIATLKGVGHNVVTLDPEVIPDPDNFIIEIRNRGFYRVVFPPFDNEEVVKATPLYLGRSIVSHGL